MLGELFPGMSVEALRKVVAIVKGIAVEAARRLPGTVVNVERLGIAWVLVQTAAHELEDELLRSEAGRQWLAARGYELPPAA